MRATRGRARARTIARTSFAIFAVIAVAVACRRGAVGALSTSASASPFRKLLATTAASLWMYGIIPFVAAAVGWGTNVLALRMTFYPLEFFPQCLAFAQVKGQPFGLLGGWQGIIPSKAGEMAAILVELMTKKLINVKEIFSYIDSKKIASIMREEMTMVTEEMFETVMTREAPLFWETLPTPVKEEMIQQAIKQSSGLLEHIILDLKENIYEVLDLRSMVVNLALSNKDKVVTMFREVGAKEFKFIERSGIYFGFLFGVVQMVVFYFTDQYAPSSGIWLLPLFGFMVGYLTNWVALKVIFSPIEPKLVCGVKLHGVFMRRQEEVSAEFARLNSEHFCNAENLWTEMIHGTYKNEFEALVRRNADSFFEKTMGSSMKKLVLTVVGEKTYMRIKNDIVDMMYESIPRCVPVTYEYQDEALQIQPIVRDRMSKLPGKDFERVLHPVFEQDEIKLIVVGGVLGALTGVAQYFAAFSA